MLERSQGARADDDGRRNNDNAGDHLPHRGDRFLGAARRCQTDVDLPVCRLGEPLDGEPQRLPVFMYRPLYWFGPPTSTEPIVDYSLSPANEPVWNSTDSSVTISLKGWKFVDGQRVDAQSVIFWLNMMKAVGSSEWGDYVGGPSEFPGNVKSYSAAGPAALSLTIHLDGSYNPTWYLYNELSQITPMAEAWDVRSLTSPGSSGHCGQVLNGDMTGTEPAVVAACKRVWAVDTDLGGTSSHPEMAGNLDTYGTNPLWHEGTDGPWLLSAFDGATGEATFSPNPDYSGPQKPVLSKFVEVPYASTSDEYKALTKGGSSGPDVGYLPLADTPRKPPAAPLTQAGPNAPALAGRYQLVQSDPWAIEFLMENFDSRDGPAATPGKSSHSCTSARRCRSSSTKPGSSIST
jgi:hypothetical protein